MVGKTGLLVLRISHTQHATVFVLIIFLHFIFSMKNPNDLTTPLLLDSSLIITTNNKLYNIKLVDCGDYCQIYFFDDKRLRKRQEDNFDLQLKKIKVNTMLEVNDVKEKVRLPNKIEEKNIIRSKLNCQRLAKANMDSWKTFITLTFADNVIDLRNANKRFRYFIDKVQRIKKDLKYLCITEFQKRGAIHYHLLTNIDASDKNLIYKQEDNKKFLHVKYWNDGFTSVEIMKNDAKKVIGYIAKYMTKDIDNRLFNHRRFFYSRNLNQPTISYINLDFEKDKFFFKKITQDKQLIYQNEYLNPYDNTKVTFLELLKQNTT